MKKQYVVGIDIGGTNTVYGIVDARGTVLASGSIKTAQYPEFDDYLKELHSRIMKLVKENEVEGEIQGIGIGAPAANYYTGEMVSPADLPWNSVIPLGRKVSEAFGGLPVGVTNDANAAAVGEMTYGAARGMKDFIMLTLGTGIGSGVVANGQLIYGHDGFAGELGHIIVKENGRHCGCGRDGCLETYCSAKGIVRTAREMLELRSDDSLMRKIPAEELTSKDIYDAAMEGDNLAREVFDYTGRILGKAIADMVAFTSPQAVILFGGLAKSGDLLLNPLKEAFEKNILFIYKGKTKILLSELKESEAALLGASALGWEASKA